MNTSWVFCFYKIYYIFNRCFVHSKTKIVFFLLALSLLLYSAFRAFSFNFFNSFWRGWMTSDLPAGWICFICSFFLACETTCFVGWFLKVIIYSVDQLCKYLKFVCYCRHWIKTELRYRRWKNLWKQYTIRGKVRHCFLFYMRTLWAFDFKYENALAINPLEVCAMRDICLGEFGFKNFFFASYYTSD